jgi:hypothetical protein
MYYLMFEKDEQGKNRDVRVDTFPVASGAGLPDEVQQPHNLLAVSASSLMSQPTRVLCLQAFTLAKPHLCIIGLQAWSCAQSC